MARSPVEDLRIVSRRGKVAACILRGVTNQWEICRQLGMDERQRSTISRDISFIKNEWRQSALRDFNEAKGRELEKLEALEKEAWEGWERSKLDAETLRSGTDGASNVSTTTKTKRDGSAVFLDTVLRCIAKRCEILGLNAPTKIAPVSPDGQTAWTPILSEMSVDELTVMDRLSERMRQVATGQSGNQEN